MFMVFSSELLDELRQVFNYNENSGLFTWKIKTRGHAGHINPGDYAGTLGDSGRIHIGYKQKYQRASVLAWWFMTGEPVPEGMKVDHRDRDPSNNAWNNLRLLNQSRNMHNSNPSTRNKSGVKGVSWDKSIRRWISRIKLDGKVIPLGTFSHFEDAVKARLRGELVHLGEIVSIHAVGKVLPDYDPRQQE